MAGLDKLLNGRIVNWVGAEGARALSEELKVNTTLTQLDLGCEATNKQ